jgi:hypothetical protein
VAGIEDDGGWAGDGLHVEGLGAGRAGDGGEVILRDDEEGEAACEGDEADAGEAIAPKPCG